MNNFPDLGDLRVFMLVARKASMAAAALELGVSTAFVSKRLRILETCLGARLLHRTTRRVVISEDGERIYVWAQRVLDNVDHLVQEVSTTRNEPRGQLRISSSFGFGRNIVAPALSRMVERYPRLTVRFELFDRLLDLAAEGIDLDVRVGDVIAPHLVARRLAANHRVLCAAPAYLNRRGTPSSLADLANHDCIVIKERDHPFGVWRLQASGAEHTVKVTGALSTNNGEIAVQWALDGHGIVLRSMWNVGPLLHEGRLHVVLPSYRQDANIWAVYSDRLDQSARVRACVNFLQDYFLALPAEHVQALSPRSGSEP